MFFYKSTFELLYLSLKISPSQSLPHNLSLTISPSQGVCKACHESCLTCKGSSEGDCFQCASGFEHKGDKCERKMLWDLLDPDVMKHLAWAIILCIAAILLFR